MKPITMFEADDGSRWPTEAEARDRDALISAVADVMAPLGPDLGDIEFHNGLGWVQHDPDDARSVRDAVLSLARRTLIRVFGKDEAFGSPISTAGIGWITRLCGDNGLKPLSIALYRLDCIDAQCREWGQPFYANNPGSGRGSEIVRNDGRAKPTEAAGNA